MLNDKQAGTAPLYLAAIGASAGGLEAITELLQHLPPELPQLAILIILHQSANHKSHLVELLSRETPWPVHLAHSGQVLESEQVYVVPPGTDAKVLGQSLQLSSPSSETGPKPSANVLFHSLAEQDTLHPIAIVLSGTGNDGAQGLAAIKQSGGWTFAQTPENARFDGMPTAAINTGKVDYVLPPAQISITLTNLLSGSLWPDALASEASSYDGLMQQLQERFGTDFRAYKPTTLMRRLQRRQTLLSLPHRQAYLDHVRQHPEELDVLFQSLLISVTSFFRDPEVFAALEAALCQLLQTKAPGDAIRIWVPGCATGEEAYTITLLLQRLLKDEPGKHLIQVFASDIDEQALETARRGLYPAAALETVPEDLRAKYFKPVQGHYELAKVIRSLVLFSRHDLTSHPPFVKLDLISCRNLLIYFGPQLQRQIMSSFHFALNPGGLLLLGSSESTGTSASLFEALDAPAKLFRRLPSTTPGARPAYKPPALPGAQRQNPAPGSLRHLMRDALFEHQVNPLVVLDENLEILEVRGDVSAYLGYPQGRLTAQLIKVCHSELQWELRSLLHACKREGQAVTGSYRPWPAQQAQHLLRLRVVPGQGIVMVVFESLDLAQLGLQTEVSQCFSSAESHELALTRLQMQTLIEELETSGEELQTLNEEMLSANEELQAANEELETANEELQSSNEELHVTYSELQAAHQILEHKEQALQQSQTHLQGLLENTVHAFLLMDRDYRLSTFNQQALVLHQRAYRKPLSEGLSLLEAFDADTLQTLLPLIQQALTGLAIEHELELKLPDRTLWLRYNLLPVYYPDHSLYGLSISALDITPRMEARLDLQKSTALLDSIFNATELGICVVDEAGRLLKVNQAYCQLYGYASEELLGQHFSKVVMPEQRPLACEQHRLFLEQGQAFPTEGQVQRKDGGYLDVLTYTRLLINPDGSRYRVSTVQDVSDSKRYRDLLNDTQRATGIGGWEWDLSNDSLLWTPEVYRIFGYPPDTPIDLDLAWRHYPPEAQRQIGLALELAREAGEPCDLALPFTKVSGASGWVRLTCRPLAVYGKTLRLTGTLQEITRQRQAEEELRKLSLVARQMPNMVAITNSRFEIEYVNEAFMRESGYALPELKGRSPLLLQGAETDAWAILRIQQAIASGQPVHEELVLSSGLGQAFWCELAITPVPGADGQVDSYIVLMSPITERKHREALLQFQSDILAHVSDSIVVCNLEGLITYWNKGAESTFGYSAQEMVGQPIRRLNPDFDPVQFCAGYQQGQNPYNDKTEATRKRSDGREVHVTLRMDVIYNAARQPIGIIKVSRDVTKRHQMEAALRRSEEQFRSLLENNADGILVLQASGKAPYVSASAERLLGYTASELAESDFLERVHPEDRGQVARQLAALQPGQSVLQHCRVRHRAGRWIWLECTHKNMLEDPQLQGYICNFRDITQRKETEQQLRQHEQLYRSIAENFPRGTVSVLDQRLSTLFSDGQEPLPQVSCLEGRYYPAGFPQPAALEAYLKAALAGTQQDFELQLAEQVYHFSVVPLYEAQQEISRLLVVAQNMSELRQAVEDKNRLIQELISKNEDLSQFTYIISHNLRAPVANLLGLVSLLEPEELSQDVAEVLASIGATAEKLDAVIRDLNQILSIRRQRSEISEQVELASELERVLASLELQYPDARSALHCELGVDGLFTIRAYLHSMLHNLLSNALKYRHPQRPPLIRLRTGREGGLVWIEVSDNGLGLDTARYQAQLFRLYKRFHPHIEGKGMGLYLIKTQAEALGGGVEFSSQPGTGSALRISIKESDPDASALLSTGPGDR